MATLKKRMQTLLPRREEERWSNCFRLIMARVLKERRNASGRKKLKLWVHHKTKEEETKFTKTKKKNEEWKRRDKDWVKRHYLVEGEPLCRKPATRRRWWCIIITIITIALPFFLSFWSEHDPINILRLLALLRLSRGYTQFLLHILLLLPSIHGHGHGQGQGQGHGQGQGQGHGHGDGNDPGHSHVTITAMTTRNPQRFGFSLTGLALSKPNRIKRNRFESFQTWAEPVWPNRFRNR